jgi:DNA-binding beta-propeller fold protein YncE
VAVCRAWYPSVLTSWRGRAAVAAAIGAVALASAAPAALAGTTAKAAPQRVIATVRVGDGPAAFAVDPHTGAVYVVNRGSRTVTVISGRSNKVAITVPIKEASTLSPCEVTVSPVSGEVYVSNCETGLSMQKTATVLSGRTNKVIATLPVGGLVNAVSPVTGDIYLTAYSSDGSSSVKVLSGRTNKVIATIPHASAVNMAVSPRTGEVYLNTATAAGGGAVTVLNGRTNKVAAVITVDKPAADPENGTYPENLAVSPVTGEVYVFSTGYKQPNVLTVIDGRTNKIITTIAGVDGLGSLQLGVGRTGTVYASGNETNTMDVISGQTNRIINTIKFSDYPIDAGFTEFAISQRTGDAYVPDIVYRSNGTGKYVAVVGVSVISAQTGKITSTIRLPKAVGYEDQSGPYNQIAVSPVTGDIYSLNPVNALTLNPNPAYEVSVISS